MKLIEFFIDEYDAPCKVISNSTFMLIEDITRQMKEIFPDKNVRDVKFIEEHKNSFEENFVF
jgi:hypothetical protein